jgi:hypothetical protein
MKSAGLLFVICSDLLLILCAAATVDGSATKARCSIAPAIHSIKIVRPNIEVTGARLKRVEIWLEPTGTGVGESYVGNAKRITETGAREKWIFPISSLPGYPHPIMAVNAFAKAYDSKGREVNRKTLGFSGITQFNAALYGHSVE